MDKEQTLKKQIYKVNSMGVSELKKTFEDLFGFPCSQTNVRNLRQRLIYRLQELAYGGLCEADSRYLDSVADVDSKSPKSKIPATRQVILPGTRYNRFWHGVEYEAVLLGDGTYEYNGKPYKSLTAIASHITGTHWSGKNFFGVK